MLQMLILKIILTPSVINLKIHGPTLKPKNSNIENSRKPGNGKKDLIGCYVGGDGRLFKAVAISQFCVIS